MAATRRGLTPGQPGMLVVPKLHCSGCGRPVPKGRRNWCSEACIEDRKIRNSPAYARQRVLERDRGVCAHCGRDCVALEAKVVAWLRAGAAAGANAVDHYMRRRRRAAIAYRFGVLVTGGGFEFASIRSLWQADHIVPVVEGGGGCGLDNLRTLCVPCHKRETRELARRRAASRRAP